MQEQLCPKCGKANRVGAKFCQYCGQALVRDSAKDNSPSPRPGSSGLFSGIRSEFEYLAEDAKDILKSLTGSIKSGAKQSDGRSLDLQPPLENRSAVSNAPTRMIGQAPAPKLVGDQFGGYVILDRWSLVRSNYYQVRQIRCPRGHENAGSVSLNHCQVCNSELLVLLARETSFDSRQNFQERRQSLIQSSQAPVPGFLRHVAAFSEGDRLYVVTEYPAEEWLSLAQVNLPVFDHATLVRWCLGLGEALNILAQGGFVPQATTLSDVLEPIVIIGSTRASFADLSLFSSAAINEADEFGSVELPIPDIMIAYLSQLIYILTSGRPQIIDRAPRDFSDVPPPFRGLLSRAVHSGYASLDEFMEVLQGALVVPGGRRSLRQIAGYRTDVGRQRERNEDFVGKYSLGLQQTPDTPEVGLYLVADGMGGHQAGEVASQDVVRVILDQIQEEIQLLQSTPKVSRSTIKLDRAPSAGDVLIQAIQRANDILYKARQEVGSDRGTTLTAALVVGQTCAVANVGDSRTYLLRAQQFNQITQDHSLVASLLAANVIQPDEVRAHPQRSRIFRNLGERPDVEVDIYEITLQAKDRLLLCSDGLWEMVLDAEIQQVLQTSVDPQEACDRLVDAANLAGGQDNISVVCVWIA
jgi:serine/threonine protein phosphatase PrpC